jgi:glycosyltransferase involved in cell wall biosynthesis
MTTPLVSIIIPAYNVQDYIEECINSALNQTYPNIEIIVVDNNSTDQTLEIVKDFKRRHPDLITILLEKKQGASNARNKGLEYVKGNWIQFLDADDLISNDKIMHQMSLIANNKMKCSFVVGSYIKLFAFNKKKLVLPLINSKDIIKSALNSELGHLNSNLFHKEKCRELGGFDEIFSTSEDTDFIFRMSLINKETEIIYDFEPKSYYRVHDENHLKYIKPNELNQNSLTLMKKVNQLLFEKKQAYYFENKNYFIDCIYYAIYKLGIYEIDSAIKLYKNCFKEDYLPDLNSKVISKKHYIALKLLGFNRMITIRNFLKTKYRYAIELFLKFYDKYLRFP